MLHAEIDAGLAVRASTIGGELRAGAVEQRLVEALLGRDDVDEAADGVGAVEQRGRPPHDLDPRGTVGVDGDAVVPGLAGEVARAHPVLQDEHAVTVEAADDRAAGAGAEAPAGDARLVLQRVAEAPLAHLDEVERVERCHGVERLERRLRAAGRGGDRHVLVHRRRGQLEVDRRDLAGHDRDRLPAGGEMLSLGEHLVGADRHARDLEGPVFLGQGRSARPDHQHQRAVHGTGVADQRHRSLHGARFLRPRGPSRQDEHRHDARRAPLPPPARYMHRCPPSDFGSHLAAPTPRRATRARAGSGRAGGGCDVSRANAPGGACALDCSPSVRGQAGTGNRSGVTGVPEQERLGKETRGQESRVGETPDAPIRTRRREGRGREGAFRGRRRPLRRGASG